ncbi:ABC transporter substrate-binding protein [Azospirillum argentinense]
MSVATLLLCLGAGAAGARSVVDLAGRTVTVPDRVERVACLEVLCYPRLFMLGAADRIVQMVRTAAPWMEETNPDVRAIPAFQGDPNLEDLLARKPDVAFFSYNTEQTRKTLETLGIPGLVSQPQGGALDSLEGYIASSKAMVRLFGQVLGGEAEVLAESWCAYFDERVAFVAGRVAGIPEDRRVRVYYVRGPEALSTQGRTGYTTWAGVLAGARIVVRDTPFAGRGVVSMEDVVRWNPEVVLVGRQYPLSLVLDDPRWRDIAAVRDGRVVPTPEGIFYWDGGPESVLLMQFIAKRIYPDRFRDLDMAEEVKRYYARFHRFALSDEAVDRLLRGESPDGSRHNPMNN